MRGYVLHATGHQIALLLRANEAKKEHDEEMKEANLIGPGQLGMTYIQHAETRDLLEEARKQSGSDAGGELEAPKEPGETVRIRLTRRGARHLRLGIDQVTMKEFEDRDPRGPVTAEDVELFKPLAQLAEALDRRLDSE